MHTVNRNYRKDNGTCSTRTLRVPGRPTVNAHVERLLRSTCPLSTADIQSITSSLQDLEASDSNLEDSIAEAQAILVHLQAVQTSVKEFMFRHKAVLHPIHSIPDDILLTIFECCTFSSEKNSLYHPKDSPPWNLSNVSRRWRALALASPRLWSTIAIASHETVNCEEIMSIKYRLSMTIRRAANCDLCVHISADSEERHNVSLLECLPILCLSSNLWSTLVMQVNEPVLLTLVEYTGGSFPRLQNMKLRFFEPPTIHLQTKKISFVACLLRNLWLGGADIAMDFPGAREEITYYSCDARHVRINHLSVFVSLRTLCIEQTVDWLTSTLPVYGAKSPIILPTVEALFVTQDEWFHSAQELASIADFPSLKTLGFIFHSFMSPFPSFEGCIDRIQTIFVDCKNPCGEPSGPLIAFLAQCRGLTSVYLGKFIVNKELLAALQDTDNRNTILLPKLTSLGVNVYSMRKFRESMTNVVSARYRGRGGDVAPLTELKIVYDKREKQETMLPPLIGERINVVYQNYRDCLENLGYRFM